MANPARAALRAKLQRRERLIGVVCDIASADLVEMFGGLGFDFVVIDCEHAGPDTPGVVNMARAARAAGYVALVRPWSTDPNVLRRYIDCGVDGLLAPDVEQAGDVERLTAAVAAADPPDRRNFILAGLLESAAGIEALPELAKAGLDLLMLGPSDLSVSLGFERRAAVPQVQRLVFQALSAARTLGMAIGAPAARYGVKETLEGGANVLVYSVKELLAASAAGVRAALAAPGA